MQTIAVVQARGGAGKSTVSAHLACSLAAAGVSTLLVDLVPGGGSSRYLGVTAQAGRADLWDVLEGRCELLSAAVRLGDEWTPRIVPAAPRLSGFEFEMRGPYRLRVVLAPLRRRQIQCVILDTGPSSSLSTRKALVAAEDVLFVVETKAPGLEDLESQMHLLAQTREQMNPRLRILGIVPSRVVRTRLARMTVAALHSRYPEYILPSIRESSVVAEAPLHRRPVTLSAPGSIGARDFEELNRAVMTRMGWVPRRKIGNAEPERPRWRGKLAPVQRPGWPLEDDRPLPKTRRVARS